MVKAEYGGGGGGGLQMGQLPICICIDGQLPMESASHGLLSFICHVSVSLFYCLCSKSDYCGIITMHISCNICWTFFHGSNVFQGLLKDIKAYELRRISSFFKVGCWESMRTLWFRFYRKCAI